MTDPKKTFYANQAKTIIARLEKRKMEGYYCENLGDAKRKVLELIGSGKKSVGYGGSMTIDHCGLKDDITAAGHELIVRENYQTPEEQKELKAKLACADTFLMSTNAITLDGELVNIDGMGNRVCYLIYGPAQVIVLAGMNKVTPTVEDAIRRVRNTASPANAVRLGCQTPCAQTGRCADCLPHTICCEEVITRSSIIPGRIKVVLVGEELGY